MKARSLKIVLAAALLTCVMMVGTSFAAPATYGNYTVTRAAAGDGGLVSLRLTWVSEGTCTAITNQWFSNVASGMDDQTLAIALTAISLGKTVRIGVESCAAKTYSAIALNN